MRVYSLVILSVTTFFAFTGSVVAQTSPALGQKPNLDQCIRTEVITEVPQNLQVKGVSPRTELYKCPAPKKDFLVLKTSGTIQQQAYHHGRLLGKRGAVNGVPKESIVQVANGIEGMGRGAQNAVWQVINCLTDRVLKSTSKEFSESINSFYQGYKDSHQGGETPELSSADYRFAGVGIELANLMDGLKYEIKKEGGKSRVLGKMSSCAGEAIGGFLFGALDFFNLKGRGLSTLGCTGFVIPHKDSGSGAMIHSRNLDGDMTRTWNNHTLMILSQEYDQKGKRYYPYVSAGTAALFYAGGISGFNDQGISVALHQMYPVGYNIDVKDNKAEIAPYLQQRILREASTLEEAIDLVKETTHFASWTIVVSEKKKDKTRVARIEISANGVEARILEDKKLAQSNHFFYEKTLPEAYAPNLNKLTESRARYKMVKKTFADHQGDFTLQDAMNLLSSHSDGLINEFNADRGTTGSEVHDQMRSFGRTPIKAYNVMTTHAVLGNGRQELWITNGELNPAPHGTYLGFSIDFKNMQFSRVGEMKSKTLQDKPHYRKSLATYVDARLAFMSGEKLTSDKLLSRALKEGGRDGIYERVYHYIRARVRHSLARDFYAKEQVGDPKVEMLCLNDASKTCKYSASFARRLMFNLALSDWRSLWGDRDHFLPYQQALIAMFANVTMIRAVDVESWTKEEIKEFSERNEFALKTFKSSGVVAAQPEFFKEKRLHAETIRNIGYVEKLKLAEDKLRAIYITDVENKRTHIRELKQGLNEHLGDLDDSDPDFVVIR